MRTSPLILVQALADGAGTAGSSWARWIHLFWLVELVALGGGLVLAHSPLGVTAATVLAGVVGVIASAVLAGRAARSAGRGVRFVDSGRVAAFG